MKKLLIGIIILHTYIGCHGGMFKFRHFNNNIRDHMDKFSDKIKDFFGRHHNFSSFNFAPPMFQPLPSQNIQMINQTDLPIFQPFPTQNLQNTNQVVSNITTTEGNSTLPNPSADSNSIQPVIENSDKPFLLRIQFQTPNLQIQPPAPFGFPNRHFCIFRLRERFERLKDLMHKHHHFEKIKEFHCILNDHLSIVKEKFKQFFNLPSFVSQLKEKETLFLNKFNSYFGDFNINNIQVAVQNEFSNLLNKAKDIFTTVPVVTNEILNNVKSHLESVKENQTHIEAKHEEHQQIIKETSNQVENIPEIYKKVETATTQTIPVQESDKKDLLSHIEVLENYHKNLDAEKLNKISDEQKDISNKHEDQKVKLEKLQIIEDGVDQNDQKLQTEAKKIIEEIETKDKEKPLDSFKSLREILSMLVKSH